MENNTLNSLRIHQRNGRDQLSRDAADLNPNNIQLHDFDVEKWMEFAYLFAEKVNYFSETDATTPSGNWQDFFIEKDLISDFLKEIEEEETGKLTPHLTLFICFLKLLELSKERLNGLTKRHLDFYYKQVLQIESIPEVEDQAHVIFNLAKSISSYLVEENTSLDGGKDAIGKVLNYKVKEELAASKTAVAQIKNIYNEADLLESDGTEVEKRYAIKAASVANSGDGLGGKLPAEDPTWYPFGYYSYKKTDNNDPGIENLPDVTPLPDAKLGFAVASPVLLMAEGTRKVTIELNFSNVLDSNITNLHFNQEIEVYLTGKKGWFGPFSVSYEGLAAEVANNTKLALSFMVLADDQSVLNYNATIHGEQFDTPYPVARLLINPNSEKGYQLYKEFAETNILTDVSISVDVQGVKNIQMEGDNGTLNPLKPFYPFTTKPVRGSSFSFYSEEAFSKKCSSIGFEMTWKNTPADFAAHYASYEQRFVGKLSAVNFITAFTAFNWDDNAIKILEQSQQNGWLKKTDGITAFKNPLSAERIMAPTPAPTPAPASEPVSPSGSNADADGDGYVAIVSDTNYFKVETTRKVRGSWDAYSKIETLFNDNSSAPTLKSNFSFDLTKEKDNTSPIRIKLNQSFLHEMFPSLYSVALTSEDKTIPIPKEPYTPFAEEPILKYIASDSVSLLDTDAIKFESRTMQFFHEQPFGQNEVHQYLKTKYGDLSTSCYALPTFCKGGELFIGLENAKVSDLVTLLIQVAEGTENPLAETFVGTQKVKWDILCNNVWREMESTLLVANEIDNFLRSGRIQFNVPDYASTDNTLLPKGLLWIRAKMFKRYDAVCKVYGVHAQAALVEFQNNGNDLAHLENGLPAKSIGKLIERVSQIKSVEQPYPTFGGRPEETDLLYYRRVSERLRHKNRAISLWDYEHLVLETFPDVYKVKCLNHSLNKDFIAPGNVCLVVIPDSINKEVFDVFQPRVSRAKLNEIRDYVSQLNSLHVQLDVVNPDYEEVQIEIKARFYKGLDENTYKAKLNEDLIRYLSPWAFSDSREITFGAVFYRSGLIHFIEKLDYVDFIREVKIYKIVDKTEVLMPTNCSPSTPRSILVSAKEHKVTIAEDCEKQITLENTETCQL